MVLPVLFVDSRRIIMLNVTDLLYAWLITLPMNVGFIRSFSVDRADAQ